MANHALPLLSSTYADFLALLDARLDDLAVGLNPSRVAAEVTNQPNRSIRWNESLEKWQRWNTALVPPAWEDLSSNYSISISGTAANATQLGGIGVSSTSDNGSVWNMIPRIKSNGVVELGRFLDFHNTSNSGVDFNVRLDTGGTTNSLFITPEGGTATRVVTESNINSTAVTLSGSQTISGVKTFANNTIFSNTVTATNFIGPSTGLTLSNGAAGTVSRTVTNKAIDLATVTDFSAVGDNVTINDVAFNLMEASSTYSSFYVPEGRYRTNLFTLNKRYFGPGKIIFGDGVVQDCAVALLERPRNLTGPLTLTSNTDIVFNPVGTVNANNHRITGLAPAVSQSDAISFNDLPSGLAKGLKFNNVNSTDPKVLDWYEEGEFTPSVVGANVPGTTTYTRRYGRFTRIGRQVRARIVVDFVVTGSNGFVKITGLPYPGLLVNTPASGVVHAGYGHGAVANIGFGGSAFQYFWYVNGSEMYIYGSESGGGGGQVADPSGLYDIDVTYDVA